MQGAAVNPSTDVTSYWIHAFSPDYDLEARRRLARDRHRASIVDRELAEANGWKILGPHMVRGRESATKVEVEESGLLPPLLTGKWMIFASPAIVDELWRRIREAVEAGHLWEHAKVTNAVGCQQSRYHEHVICVYTRDWTDRDDVCRIREALRTLGVTWVISYKTDETTSRGIYAGQQQIVAQYRS